MKREIPWIGLHPFPAVISEVRAHGMSVEQAVEASDLALRMSRALLQAQVVRPGPAQAAEDMQVRCDRLAGYLSGKACGMRFAYLDMDESCTSAAQDSRQGDARGFGFSNCIPEAELQIVLLSCELMICKEGAHDRMPVWEEAGHHEEESFDEHILLEAGACPYVADDEKR